MSYLKLGLKHFCQVNQLFPFFFSFILDVESQILAHKAIIKATLVAREHLCSPLGFFLYPSHHDGLRLKKSWGLVVIETHSCMNVTLFKHDSRRRHREERTGQECPGRHVTCGWCNKKVEEKKTRCFGAQKWCRQEEAERLCVGLSSHNCKVSECK